MKYRCLLIVALMLTGCGGRTISTGTAQKLIADAPAEKLGKENVEVTKVIQVGKTEAIVETRLKAAFRFEKIRGEWVIREVRIGQAQWENINDLAKALEDVKIAETRGILERIADAVLKYLESTGRLPVFTDYIALSDLLSPKYMTPLIRLDAWRRPLFAKPEGANTILLWSAGPDGRSGTSDDIRRTVSP
jgi:hypothetical protein